MCAELALTVVADNTALRRGLMAEHGLAIWLEYAATQFLLDSGQGLVLMPNLKALGFEVQALAGVAVSHGHYDHTGGIVSLMQARTRPLPIYAHPDILATKFSCSDGICHEVGVDAATRRLLHSSQVDLLLTSAPRQLIPGLWLTGSIPRQYPVETRATPFFLDHEARTADPLDDDQALFAEVEGGIVVILGCAHAGLINTLAYVQELTNHAPLRAVIGGMHLRQASPEHLQWIITRLQRFKVQALYPLHCTGLAATMALWQSFPDICGLGGCGMQLHF